MTGPVRPLVADAFDLDPLTAVAAVVEVRGARLREGMVLVDEFDMPTVGLDASLPTVRNSGCKTFNVYNFDTGTRVTSHLHTNKTFRVAAR